MDDGTSSEDSHGYAEHLWDFGGTPLREDDQDAAPHTEVRSRSDQVHTIPAVSNGERALPTVAVAGNQVPTTSMELAQVPIAEESYESDFNSSSSTSGDDEFFTVHEQIQPSRHRTVIQLSGYQYTRARQSRFRTVYRCSVYRRTACRGKVDYDHRLEAYVNFVSHTCRDNIVVSRQATDVTSEMEREIDRIALTFQTRTAQLVWEEVNTQFYQGLEGRVVQGLTRDQVLSRVHRVRRVQFGGNIHGVVEVPGLSLVTGTQLTFFQFHHVFYEGNNLQRIIGWAHPRLLELLRYPGVQIFIDGTFRAVPRPFHQCVIVMVRDAASRVFVPVFYNLTTNRTAPTYRRLLRFINDAADHQLQPGSIVVDFEQALIDSVQRQFTEARIVGCLFHWKQALRRRLGGLRMPQNEIRLAMEIGVVDMLTVVPPGQVDPHGIAWVERTMRQLCNQRSINYSSTRWAQFWIYFRRTWIILFPPEVWNVHGMDLQVVSRTNNPLERFNQELNASITAPHPSLPSFVGTIDALSQRYVQLLIDITNRRATAPAQLQILLPEPVQLIPTATRGRRSSVRARSRRPRRGRGGRVNAATTTVNRTNAHSRRSTRNIRNTTSS